MCRNTEKITTPIENYMFTDTLVESEITNLIQSALLEDIRGGDVTTESLIGRESKARAVWIAKQDGVVAGLEIAKKVFCQLDNNLDWNTIFKDGDWVKKGNVLAEMSGLCRAILMGERVALNFAQRMSGIATETAMFVQQIEGLPAIILDTRKTVPGMRALDKYAVKAGGGQNHRMGLYDMVMIKDNHIVTAGGIKNAVSFVKEKHPEHIIEVEITSLEEADQAIAAGADIIMLDNMPPEIMKEVVLRVEGRTKTEASGNISLHNVREVAETGVDYISVGALTHSVSAFDISQKIKEII